MTQTHIPAAGEIREQLSGLTREQLGVLAQCSDTPFPTLWKIKSGEIQNPGIDTVRKFFGLIETVKIGGTAKAA